MHTPDWHNVQLQWNAAESDAAPTDLLWSTREGSYNLGPGSDFTGIVRFEPSDLTSVAGQVLSSVSFIPAASACTYSIKVWQGGNFNNATFTPGTLIVDQEITSQLSLWNLNTIALNTPIAIDTTQELWIGIDCITSSSQVLGLSGNGAVANKGEILFWNGGWSTVTEVSGGLSANWVIIGSFTDPNNTPSGYNVYRDYVQLNTTPITGTSYIDTVAAGTYIYDVTAVYTNGCESDSITTTVTMVDNPCANCTDSITIGSGELTGYTIPLNNYYRYSYTQQIYTASEIGNSAGLINCIAFQYVNPSSQTKNIEVYLGNTNKTSFSNDDDFISTNNMQLCYEGPWSLIASEGDNWINIPFSTPFEWDGTSNIVIAIVNNTGTFESEDATFVYDTTETYTTLLAFSDNYPYNVETTIPTDGERLQERNNVRFLMGGEISCWTPMGLTVSDLTSSGATISWTGHDTDAGYEVVVVPAGGDVNLGTAESISDTFYIVTGCAGNTEYDVYVRAICADGNSNWVMTTIHTTCQYIETLPYTENFDLYDDGAGNTPDCWFINSDPTTPPYISSLHHASGSNSLFLEDAAGRHSCAILPAISTDFYSINTLQVSFKALKTFDSFGHLIVGVMSDPTNMNTFTPVKTFDGPMYSGSNVWNEFTVYFNTYEGMGTHIAFYAPGDYTSEVYIDDVEVKLITGCATPRDFDTEHVSGSSVYLTWNEGEYVDESVVYNIEYTVQGEENWQMADTPTGTNCLITGLTPGTTYDAMLYVTCSNGYSDTLTLSFTTGCLANADVTIGTVNENDYSSYIPLKTNEKYYISQQLFTATEMGDSNSLYGLKLYVIRTGGQPTREVDIYLGNTTLSSLSTYNSVSGHTKVFSGTIDISSTGWTEIAFDSAFAYTGNNLLLTIDDNTGNYIGSGCRFAVHTQTNGSLYAIDYSSDINPISNAASFNPRNQRSSIIFVGECDTTAVVCATPTLFISNVTPNGAEMFWAPGYTETEWELDYKRAVDSTWTSEGIIYQNSHILTNLEVSTEYDVRLRSICGTDEYSDYTEMSFETPCSYISELPFTENFDSIAINTIPVCWSETHNNPTAVPQVSNAQSFVAGGNSLHLDNGGTFYTSIVCTPHIADEFAMNNLKISFFTYGGTTEDILEVGIMADPATPSTFYSLGTISPVSINTWESHEFFTNEYTGNGRYIAFKVPMGRINEIYVDELTIDAIPNCSRVENLTLTAVDSTSASFSWTPGSTESQWEYVILPAGHVNLDTVQNINVTYSEFHTEYDLQHTTDYTFYIRAICNSGENSDWAHLDFSTRQNPAQLPYICDFESANPGWEFYNEPNTNKWVIGNAVNNGGSKALYISKNNGNSHSYGGYISDNWAYRDIYFPASEDGYIISFDWKANGEADDYMNVFIGDPIDIDSANHILTGEGFAGLEKMNNDTMHLQESFTNFNYILAGYATASVKRIYFAWHNDLFVQHDPPAAIDNFMVSEISCPIPSALTVNNITATTADLTWTETGTASEWVVSYKPSSSTTWTTVPVFETSYQLTDLTPEVTYTVHVAAVCDADGTLSPISNTVQFSTPASCPVPTNLTCTGHTSTTIDLSWSAGDAESMWIVSYKTEGSDWSTAIEANAVDTTYTITNLTFATPYIIRVKAACNATSQSVWSDSIVVIPGSHIMSATGSASITTCGTIIYDDGGLGDYSNGANSVLTIYPENPGEFVVISGTSTTEYNHDFIYVYDGEGTYGELLNTYSGTGRAILDTSITGPITIHFSADATMHYAGFEITTSCSTVGADDGEEEQDPCIAPTNVNVTADITTADVTWTAGGTETTWVVEYMLATADYWSSSDSLSTTSYQITGLTASTDYFVRVKAICSQDNESEWSDTVSFTTLDEVIPTYTITATAMGPGTITPEGTLTVDEGSDITFTFTADEGAIVSQLLVDEMETAIPENNEYTFSAIVANHTIAVTFEEDGDDTGIDDVNLDNAVLLFPNPATSYIEIRLQNNALNNATMEIYDVYGRKVATQTMNNNSLQVNISDYSAGMYLVRIFNENGVVVKNFIKK